jgi:hypothetical protein
MGVIQQHKGMTKNSLLWFQQSEHKPFTEVPGMEV